jgi:hypothetical protein
MPIDELPTLLDGWDARYPPDATRDMLDGPASMVGDANNCALS